tara:strand:+ start:8871 stop:9038 length:168 start_codon:yes stop_codon:yes gene_type:complete
VAKGRTEKEYIILIKTAIIEAIKHLLITFEEVFIIYNINNIFKVKKNKLTVNHEG